MPTGGSLSALIRRAMARTARAVDVEVGRTRELARLGNNLD
ncbi:MAG: hypothetical protein OXI46_00180 [Gemmatimonadota bacterium]|nr:hypothetical protein [Gemmatimonadota bacterium]